MDATYAAAQRSLGGPAWRSKLVEQLPGRRSHQHVQACDDDVRRLHHYRQLCNGGSDGVQQAVKLYPAITGAEALDESDKLDLLKIAVLGGLDSREIAQRLRLDEKIVSVWEKLYFDVRGMREAVSWIHSQVIGPERTAGHEELAARLKFVVATGAVGARAVLDLDTRAPLDEGQRLFDRQLKLQLKFDAAVEMPTRSNREKMFFIRTFADMKLRQNRLRLEEQRLQRRCQEALDRQQHARIRRELTEERMERREAARDRRERERRSIREAKAKLWQHEVTRREAFLLEEAQAAAARAIASPLSQLTWHKEAVSTNMPFIVPLPLGGERETSDESWATVMPGMSLPVGASEWSDVLGEDDSLSTKELFTMSV